MRSRKPFHIFWPQYFDLKRTRSDGRKISKKLAIEKITAQDIAKAATSLGYQAQYEGHEVDAQAEGAIERGSGLGAGRCGKRRVVDRHCGEHRQGERE